MSKIRVAVIGAGGKMGTRTSKNLAKLTDKYDLMLVENAPKGIESIHARGLDVIPVEEALEKAEVVVFAVPDTLIKKLSAIYVPMLKPGTGFLILDPAAAVAKELGGEIKLAKCVRFEKGEGIEKKQDDFAAEVASMAK